MTMGQQITSADITGIGLAAADRCARRIGRSLRLPPSDIHDIRQELLLELVRRAPRFDGQAPWPAFARMVIRHAGQDTADRWVRHQRRLGGSLEDIEQCSEGDGLSAWWAGGVSGASAIHLRLDLQRFLESLPAGLRRLCHLLADEDRADALAGSGFSRSEFFRQLLELRMRLRAFGIAPLGRSGQSAGTWQ
ncbi:MAG: sigma-70 family RNA polymerase sigma factor [Alphaproteobacteria bacterium]|nr:sigma-70 family RNA polymerase sigma factor [Alphaproteobacteria bacterium]